MSAQPAVDTHSVPHWTLSRAGDALWLASPSAALLAAASAKRLDAALVSAASKPCAASRHGLALSRVSPGAGEPVFALAFDRGAQPEAFFSALGRWAQQLVQDAPRCQRNLPDATERLRQALRQSASKPAADAPLPSARPDAKRAALAAGALIAFDADGVLLDYNERFAECCRQTFGVELRRAPGVYHHFHNAFNFPLSPEQKTTIRAAFAHDGWRTMPAVGDAAAGIQRLAALGAQMVCVTSMPSRFASDRHFNLASLGMPFSEVVATGRDCSSAANPKAAEINARLPAVFVEDQLRNFDGVDPRVCRVYIDRGYEDRDHPDAGLDAAACAHFSFPSVEAFAEAFERDPAPFLARSLAPSRAVRAPAA